MFITDILVLFTKREGLHHLLVIFFAVLLGSLLFYWGVYFFAVLLGSLFFFALSLGSLFYCCLIGKEKKAKGTNLGTFYVSGQEVDYN